MAQKFQANDSWYCTEILPASCSSNAWRLAGNKPVLQNTSAAVVAVADFKWAFPISPIIWWCVTTLFGWFFSQISISCSLYVLMLNEGNSQSLQFMSAMQGKANNVHPIFPSTVYHFGIPRMRIVTNSVRITGSCVDGFTKRTKCLNLCVKLSFWMHPAL